MMRRRAGFVAAVVGTVGSGLWGPVAPAEAATSAIALAEIVASWQGNDRVEFIELALTAQGATAVAGADILIDDRGGEPSNRRIFTLTQNVANGVRGARILIATNEAADLSGFPTPDFVLPSGVLDAEGGRVCYRTSDSFGTDTLIDCVAYGSYSGRNPDFGRPTRLTPGNRALVRVDTSGTNRDDWDTALEPKPENNAGNLTTLPTLCGDGRINQGEDCDGSVLGGTTCEDLGFAKGKLKCDECHFDTSACSFCGNDELNKGEQCDGDDLNDKTCAAIGFTGGTLNCNDKCQLATDECDPTFFVPGGGPLGPECLSAWRIMNGTGRPKGDGKALPRQKCKDGDLTCDADTVPGQCTFRVAVCFNRLDARLPKNGESCKRLPIGFWQLKSNTTQPGIDLLNAVSALGPSTIGSGAVTFGPALSAGEQCTATQDVVVARGSVAVLRSRTTAESGRPRDVDALRLACTP